MRFELGARAGLAAVCAAGVVASAITYRSDRRLDRAYDDIIDGRSSPRTLGLARGGETLHPDTRADAAKAVVALNRGDAAGALRWATRATRREPENAAVWVSLARIRFGFRQLPQAQAAYARAKALDSQLPRTPYPQL